MFQSKLQAATGMALAMGVTVFGIARVARSAPDPTAEDQKNLQGTWIMMTEEDQGRKLPEEKLQTRFRLVIKDAKWTLKENQGPEMKQWKVKLDATRRPKQGDFTYLFGNNKGRVSFGIYELKGDTLRLCIAEPGENRPTRFEGKGKNTLIHFKRTNPND
jgi:uncharacterized protein (TIGR03067 family)